MNGYLAKLERANTPLPAVTDRVALLTGRSSFASPALSPQQLSFLKAIAPSGYSILETAFPYDLSLHGTAFRETGMLAASWRNMRQVCWSIRNPAFRAIVAGRMQALFDATGRHLILITGSCGLQLANSAWPQLRPPANLRIDVIALGPACFGRLRMPAKVIQGRRDFWSRLFYRGPVDHYCDCGHLDYWDSESVRGLIQ